MKKFLILLSLLFPYLVIALVITLLTLLIQVKWVILADDIMEYLSQFQFFKNPVLKYGYLFIFFVINLKIINFLFWWFLENIFCFFKFLFTKNHKKKLIKQYISLLYRYTKQGKLKYIWKSHYFFFSDIISSNFFIKDNKLSVFYTPFEEKTLVENFNNLCMKFIDKNSYIKSGVEIWENYYIFSINKGNLTSEKLVKKIEEHRDEIQRFFTKQGFKAKMITKKKWYDDVFIQIYNENELWEKRNLELENFSIEKWELLCGFVPQIKKWVQIKDYIIKTESLNHSFVVGATRSWKDVFIRNILTSCLYNILNYKNLELHFFDTKWNDWAFLDNLKSCGVVRYTNINEYTENLDNILNEMKERTNIIWKSSSLIEYNEVHQDKPLKEKIIIINEFLSLTKSLEKEETKRLLNQIISLTSEWAGAGFKVILMSQTRRWDITSEMGKIIANIENTFVLKLNNKNEKQIIASEMADESEKARVKNIQKYNCIHIENNELQEEFKSYFFSQIELIDWIEKNFKKYTQFEKDNINDYFKYAEENNEISMKIAQEKFKLTRTDWDKFISYIEENNLIERLPNNKIIWKKEESSKEKIK